MKIEQLIIAKLNEKSKTRQRRVLVICFEYNIFIVIFKFVKIPHHFWQINNNLAKIDIRSLRELHTIPNLLIPAFYLLFENHFPRV